MQTTTGNPGKFIIDSNLRVLFGVTLMAVLGVASLTPAFPKIAAAFNLTSQKTGLLITVFTLPGVILSPVLGVLADRYGRKRILAPSLFLFGLAGFSCAFCHDFNLLLVFRFLQGCGAGALGSLNYTIIGDLYSGQELRVAMGYNGGVLNIGTALYPAIGGILASFGWRFPFLMPLLAIPAGLAVLIKLKNPEPQQKQNMKDYLRGSWQTFRNRQAAGLFLASFMTFVILYGALMSYYPFFMRERFDSGVIATGFFISSMSIASGFFSAQTGRLSLKFTPLTLLIAGWLCCAAAMALIPFVRDIRFFILPTVLYGVANGLNMPTMQSLLATYAPMENRAAFMSANGMILRLAQTLGPLFTGFIFTLWGLPAVFSAASVLALLMLPVARFMIAR